MAASGHSDAGPARFVFGPGRAWDDDARLAEQRSPGSWCSATSTAARRHCSRRPPAAMPTVSPATPPVASTCCSATTRPPGFAACAAASTTGPPPRSKRPPSDVRALLRDVVDRTGPRLVFHGHWHHPNRDHLAGTGAEVIGSTLTAGPAVPPSWTSRRSPPPSSTATSAATLTVDANTPRRRGRALPDRHAHSPVERPEGLRRGFCAPRRRRAPRGVPVRFVRRAANRPGHRRRSQR